MDFMRRDISFRLLLEEIGEVNLRLGIVPNEVGGNSRKERDIVGSIHICNRSIALGFQGIIPGLKIRMTKEGRGSEPGTHDARTTFERNSVP